MALVTCFGSCDVCITNLVPGCCVSQIIFSSAWQISWRVSVDSSVPPAGYMTATNACCARYMLLAHLSSKVSAKWDINAPSWRAPG